MSEVKNTPTPWVAIKGHWEPWDGAIEISSGDYTIAYTTSGGNEEANAAHIVKCVNMHNELVGYLMVAADILEMDGGRPMVLANIRETLKKAGAL